MPKKKLLIIDDDETLSMLLAIRLRHEGYSVECGKDGMEGLKKAEQMRPDLILLDANMPKLSGFEVASKLRQSDLFIKTPILMLTALSQDYNIKQGYSVGVDDYLVKPFNLEHLLIKVQKHLN